jgi:hypothetical protein
MRVTSESDFILTLHFEQHFYYTTKKRTLSRELAGFSIQDEKVRAIGGKWQENHRNAEKDLTKLHKKSTM